MNNFGNQLAVIKPSRGKIILESFIVLIVLFFICLTLITSIDSFNGLLIVVVFIPIVLAIYAFYIIKIIIVAFDKKTIVIYEHVININNFTCPYKNLKLQVSDSKLDKKIIFSNGTSSKVVRGYINTNDYNLILNKIKSGYENSMSTKNTHENLKSIISPNKFIYTLFMSIGLILLNRYLIFNLEYNFVEYIIILLLYFFLCFLIFSRINKQKIYLYETYLKIDDFVAPYRNITLKFSKKPFCKNILFYYLDKTKKFDCYISKKDLNIICNMVNYSCVV